MKKYLPFLIIGVVMFVIILLISSNSKAATSKTLGAGGGLRVPDNDDDRLYLELWKLENSRGVDHSGYHQWKDGGPAAWRTGGGTFWTGADSEAAFKRITEYLQSKGYINEAVNTAVLQPGGGSGGGGFDFGDVIKVGMTVLAL